MGWYTSVVAAPPPEVLFVYDLRAPAVVMPVEMAQDAWDVIDCESEWDSSAIGGAGERGLLQIHPIHIGRMEKEGLDWYKEEDRMKFAILKYRESGWEPWSCAP